jgi:hypothetical protein
LKKSRGVYVAIWSVTGGDGDSAGVGTVENGKLVIGWRVGNVAAGLHIAEPTANGFICRWWSLPGNGLPQKETWTLLKKDPNKAKPQD